MLSSTAEPLLTRVRTAAVAATIHERRFDGLWRKMVQGFFLQPPSWASIQSPLSVSFSDPVSIKGREVFVVFLMKTKSVLAVVWLG